MQQYAERLNVKGRIFVYSMSNTNDHDVKLTKRALHYLRYQIGNLGDKEYIIIAAQEHSKGAGFVEFLIETAKGSALLVSTESSSGLYGLPVGHMPTKVEARKPNGATTQTSHVSFGSTHGRLKLALVVKPDGQQLHVGSGMPNDELGGLQGTEKIRKLVRGYSMGQFKSGLSFREAPCLLAIWADALFAHSALTVAAALYGDCRIRFSLTKSDQPSEATLEGNAAFLRSKNTTVSAAFYVPEGGEPMVFHNPFAARKISTGLLPGREYVVQDGSIELIAGSSMVAGRLN